MAASFIATDAGAAVSKRAAKSLNELRREDLPLATLAKALGNLQELAKSPHEDATNLHKALTRHVERGRIKAGIRLQSELREALGDITIVTDRPLVIAIGEAVVECDITKDVATVLYGKETVATTTCDAKSILAAADALAKDHELWAAEPATETFARLHRAYQVLLLRTDHDPGARIDIVDLLIPLAFFATQPATWRRSQKLDTYPAHRLAFDLTRLRRHGLLEHDGLRLDLGVATGGSTAKKQNVLFIPTSPTSGQYFVSLRFL